MLQAVDLPAAQGVSLAVLRVLILGVPIAASWPKKRQAAARAGTEWPTKKPDLDNFMKTIDACNLIVWVDDSQIVKTSIEKRYGDKPGMWLQVRPIFNKPTEGIFG